MSTAPTTDLDRYGAYITGNLDGTYDAFVQYEGCLERVRLRDALSFIRRCTGRTDGQVPYWNRERRCWESGFDLNP